MASTGADLGGQRRLTSSRRSSVADAISSACSAPSRNVACKYVRSSITSAYLNKDRPGTQSIRERRARLAAHSPRLNGPEVIDHGVRETGLEASPRKFADVGEHFVSRHPRDRL